MALHLFAGIPVRDYTAALDWYERLFGAPPLFAPNDTESVWELAPHRYVYVELLPERAGFGHATVLVDDLDAFVSAAAERGVDEAERETYENGVTKVIYRDPEGNQIGFGGAPPED